MHESLISMEIRELSHVYYSLDNDLSELMWEILRICLVIMLFVFLLVVVSAASENKISCTKILLIAFSHINVLLTVYVNKYVTKLSRC